MQKKTVTVFLIFFCLSFIRAQNNPKNISGYVYDRQSGQALNAVHVFINDSLAATTDKNGFFRMPVRPGRYILTTTRIGFKKNSVTVVFPAATKKPLRIFMEPAVLELKEEITVYANRQNPDPLDANRHKWLNSTDDIIQRFEGVSLFRRANFAYEPSIRGSSAGQISVTIDGAKMFNACVDRMDPVTAYIEVENLDRAEVSKGAFDLEHNQTVGGSFNFVTEKADYGKPFTIQSEAGYESVSSLQRIRLKTNYSKNGWAVRLSGSLKGSDDYYAGGHRLISNSGFKKNNYSLSLGRKINEKQDIKIYYIGDNAWDIGYPALIMDARKTQSHIVNAQYTLKDITPLWNRFSFTLYYNSVFHWMDDYDRSIEEIKNREVMPGMYMPMYGETATAGFLSSFTFAGEKHILTALAEYYHLSAFADMDMYALNPDISPAYLINIADARINNFALTLKHNWLLSALTTLRTDLRLDYSQRDLFNEYGKRPLQSLYPNTDMKKDYLAFGISFSLEHSLGDKASVLFKLAQSQRMPTHMENYGYMLYNVLDGYFYYGNPELKPERSVQAEAGLHWRQSDLNWQLSAFVSRVKDYISGYIMEDEFKRYQNFDHVYLAGAEGSLAWNFTDELTLFGSVSYTYGQNAAFDEPLPYIPPLTGSAKLQYAFRHYWFEAEGRFAADQTRIAHKTTREDYTPGFFIFSLRARVALNEHWKIKLGIENAFDRYYYEHLSISNLPGRGRNLYAGLQYRID